MQDAGGFATNDVRIETVADLEAVLAALATSPRALRLVLAALAAVRKGVITGEGPTTTGRIHHSRCVDAADTALIRRILTTVGEPAITRAEADALFDILDAALERVDGGAFDELIAKAITQHVLAAAGVRVPSRARALAPTTALAEWASPGRIALRGEAAAWLAARLRRKPRKGEMLASLAALVGAAAPHAMSIAAIVDLAA
jgi:hypothetical protein